MTRNDYGDFSALLISKFQVLETKVDALNQDRVTRSDFENLRKEISGSYVPRDAYEARHSVLIERDAQLELQNRESRKSSESDTKELREYTDKGLQRLEDSIKQQTETQLSSKDRNWMRFTQAVSILSFIAVVLDWIFQHIKFQ